MPMIGVTPVSFDAHDLDTFLLVGSAVTFLAILAVRISSRAGLPSLLLYLLMGVLLAAVIAAVALAEAAMSLLTRWLSSRIGEGLILDLRTAVFDHVQRMPVAFFTVPTVDQVAPESVVRRTTPPSHNTFARSAVSVARSLIVPVVQAFPVALPVCSSVDASAGLIAHRGCVLVAFAPASSSTSVAGLQAASRPVSTGRPLSSVLTDDTMRRSTFGPAFQVAPES